MLHVERSTIAKAKPPKMEKQRVASLRLTRVNSLTKHRRGVIADLQLMFSSEGQAAMSLFARLPDEYSMFARHENNRYAWLSPGLGDLPCRRC
jgi:hypothetical protein